MTEPTTPGDARPTWRPTRRAALVALVLTAPLFASAAYPWMVQVVLALDALLLCACAAEGAWLARRHGAVRLQRRLPQRWSLGERGVITALLENRGDADLVVRVIALAPRAFDIAPHDERMRLKAGGRARVQYEATPTLRGDHAVGGLSVEVFGRLGLASAAGPGAEAAAVRVLPSLRGLRRIELAARRALDTFGLRKLRRHGDGDEFEHLRDYRPDDDFRHVDWKATARRQRPITRVHQAERAQTVLLCVETGRTMAARAGALSKLDHAVNAALMLAYAATRMGDRVGLVLFSDTVEALVPPRAGREHLRHVLDALCGATSSGRFVDYRVALRAVRAASRRRALLVFFTDALDENELAPLLADARHLTRQHLPLLVALTEPELDTLATRTPERAADVYVQAVAQERLHEREVALRAFRSEGGLAAMVSPERAGTLAVNRYLAQKRRRRL